MTELETIAVIGLGAMGLPMARRLLAGGHAVRGFDINPASLSALAEVGGTPCQSASVAAEGASALLLMVVNASQARDVLFGQGALAALDADAVVISTLTCSASDALSIGTEIGATGRQFVDAPVTGGVAGATAGSLTIMAAAPGAIFRRAKPLLELMGKRVFHVGEAWGQGSALKTINQLLAGVHIAAAAEAMALGEKAGLDTRQVLEILSGGAAGSWMLNDRGPAMLQADPPTKSAVDIFVKDLGLVLDAGRANSMALPIAAMAHQMFLAASGAGHGKADDSQVIRAYRALNGITG
jgi:L-threonate 2-dehydrogenase